VALAGKAMLNSIRGSIRYTGACAALENGNLTLALTEIEEAKRLLGNRLNKPGVYYVNLKAAEIYLRAGYKDKAKYHLEKALEQIYSHTRISSLESQYLLDYCDLFRNDICDLSSEVAFRVNQNEYHLVRERIRKEFPINWV
jgi:predicted Zn-dependent protease